jgi:hypothetical protein
MIGGVLLAGLAYVYFMEPRSGKTFANTAVEQQFLAFWSSPSSYRRSLTQTICHGLLVKQFCACESLAHLSVYRDQY